MTPKRLVDERAEGDELVRAVLESGLTVDPPPSAERAVWQSLSVALAVPPVPNAAGAGAGSGASAGVDAALKGAPTLVTLGKGFVLGVGVSLAVAGAGRLGRTQLERTHATAAPRGPATVMPSARVPVPAVNPVPELPTPGLDAPVDESSTTPRQSVRPAPAHDDAAPALPAAAALRAAGTSSVAAFPLAAEPASAKSRLEEEAAMLRNARAELQGGRLAEAFATLEASRERFSAPELAQEREALLIELLYRSGQRASAAQKASSFLARYPTSPHAAKVRSFTALR